MDEHRYVAGGEPLYPSDECPSDEQWVQKGGRQGTCIMGGYYRRRVRLAADGEHRYLDAGEATNQAGAEARPAHPDDRSVPLEEWHPLHRFEGVPDHVPYGGEDLIRVPWPAVEMEACSCGHHDIDPTRDRYEQHRLFEEARHG